VTDRLGKALSDALRPIVAELVDEEFRRRLGELEAPVWLTLDQVADRYGTSKSALRKRLQRGQLPGAVKDGNRWLVDRRQVDAALADGTLARSNENMGRAPRERPRPRHRRS
jgi:excisionase family DNA binding protein